MPLLVAGAMFMENLDGTVITTALPDMARSFQVAPLDMNVGVSAYLLTLGVFIPISGWVAQRFGARRVFSAALALFTLASVLCGMAGSLAAFTLVRVLQGIGGALMVPVGRLAVLDNTPRHKLADAIATLTWPALVAPVLGPPIGGFIASYASWRWIFYLNLPVGLLAIVMAWRLVPPTAAARPRRFDLQGFLLVGGALGCLAWAAELLARPDAGAARAAPFFAVGAILFVTSIRHLRRAPEPLFDLRLLSTDTFAVAIFGGSLARMAIGAVPFLLPLMFQVGFGLDAFHAGLLVLAVFAGNLVMKIGTTRVLRAFRFRRVLLVNGLLNVAAILACALLSPATPVPVIAAVLFVGGLTRSMQFSAYNTIAFADIPRQGMAAANALSSTVSQLAMGLGVALGALGVRLGHVALGWLVPAALPAGEFRIAFVLVAVVGLAALVDSLRLAGHAGLSAVGK
jgi:EmrB/QacA subfamily drug resistance transporter